MLTDELDSANTGYARHLTVLSEICDVFESTCDKAVEMGVNQEQQERQVLSFSKARQEDLAIR